MQRVEVPEVSVSAAMPSLFSPARIDALKEVASIGAGHAATALSLMTGARIMNTLLNDLRTLDRKIGVETMCVGGGQGMAMVVERL